jgi:syntaxin 6
LRNAGHSELIAHFLAPQDSAINSHELKDAKKQLKRHVRIAESTLKDVVMTVQVVENDRLKFAHIDDNNLYGRNTLVQTSRDRLSRAKDEMQSEAVKAKLLQDERAKAARRAAGTMAGSDAETTVHRAIDSSHTRESLLMQHQDETLDELGEAVVKVGHMAETINEEIGQQNKMLSEMEEDLEHVEEELGMVMGKLAKVLKTKDRWQLGTIICLTFTVVILFLMVLYF